MQAIASTFIPGLGQFCDGRYKSGALFLGGTVAGTIGTRALALSALNSLAKTAGTAGNVMIKTGGKGKMIGALALGAATAALGIANIVDAYKGGNSKVEA